MSDDRADEALLRDAARAFDDEARAEDHRLEALSRGQLSPAAADALAEEAQADPALAEAVALHAPLSAPAQDRLFEAAAAGRPPRLLRSWGWAAAAALAAAVLATLFVPRTPDPLPAYAWRVRVEQARFRGDEAPVTHTVRADTEVQLVLAPTDAVTGELEAFLYRRSPEPRRLSTVVAERSPDGAVRWRAAAGRVAERAQGRVELVAVVARPGSAPSLGSLALEPASGPGWQSAGVAFTIEPVASPLP